VHNQARIVIKKRGSSLQVFFVHIITKAMEIEFSAALLGRAIIKYSEYFLFPDPKHPSTSFASAGLRLAAACVQH
jgi:hypothetical protein